MGGGVDGSAHPGALSVLEQAGVLQLEKVAGTSAGAIMASLVAMKYNATQIKAIMDNTDMSKFKDGNWVQDIEGVNKYGLHPGVVFLDWIKTQIRIVTNNPTCTFADFRKYGFLDLHVFACNMNTCSLDEFCVDLTPNVAVCDAVRASMSIPWFFQAYKIGNQFYRDGGMMSNFPIDFADTNGVINPETIGVCFGYDTQVKDNGLKTGEYEKAVEADVALLMAAQYRSLQRNHINLSRSIMVSTHGISPTNFSLSPTEKETLYNAGRIGAYEWMKQYNS